ncbi:MAG: protein kinase [Myxococcota bacterium]|nr:protein kinase [Myxococcota bacterium]
MVGARLSHYEILEPLGTGGMGAVYLAKDTRLLRQVALKVLSSESTSDTQRQRFIQEARAASALNHSGIVAVYDIGNDQGQDFIAMEYVKGQSLAQALAAKEALPWPQVHKYVLQIAGAMRTAHDAGIVHRDLKPHNVMITEDDHIKILDFGIAKLNPVADFDLGQETMKTALTGQGHVIGTLAYMSPEQAIGDPVDKRSDIFSLGIVLYEMLAGRRPFEADSDTSLMHQLHFDMPEPLTQIREDVPEGVDKIIQTALAKRPQDRYQSMEHLASDLEALSVDRKFIPPKPRPAPTALAGPQAQPARDSGLPQDTSLSRVFITLAKRPKRSLLTLAILVLSLGAIVAFGLIQGFERPTAKKVEVSDTTLAILPFENIGNDPELATLCVGLTESLTNGLGQVNEFKGKLQIIPAAEVRNSNIKTAKQARESFGAGLIVGGSLQREDQDVRMNVNLVKGTSQLAAANSAAGMKEIDALQRRALLKIVGFLRSQEKGVLPNEDQTNRPDKPNAVSFFKQGMKKLDDYVNTPGDLETIESAIDLFQKALAIDPNYAAASAGLSQAYGRKYLANKDGMWLEKALQLAQRAVELDQHLGIARVSLGLAHVEKGNDQEALDAFNQSLILDPFSADGKAGLGQVWEVRGDIEKAAVFFEEAVDLDSSNRELHDLLGNAYYHLGRYQMAEVVYLKSVELAPNSRLGHSNLSSIYVMQGKYNLAATHLQRALEIQPNPTLYSNLGTLYFFQGRYTDAVSAFKKAVAMPGGANNFILWVNLADAYRWTPDNEVNAKKAYECAIRMINEKLKNSPDSADLISRKAICLAKIENHSQALKILKRIKSKSIQNPQIHYRMSVVFEISGKRELALKSLEQAVRNGYSIEDVRVDPELEKLRQDPKYHLLFVDLGKTEKK